MSRSQRALGAGLAVAVLVAAAVSSAPAAGGRKLQGNNFYSNCRFSHTAADDPILLPGKPGLSHHHTFFGNRSTKASSTVASLQRSATTCYPLADKAAYWVPTLYQNGREIRPQKAQVYYVVIGYEMRAFPRGLRVVAGDMHATRPQSSRVTYWTCAGRAARTAPSRTLPAHCGVIAGHGLAIFRGHRKRVVRWRTKSTIELQVVFPDCWDGRHLDSADHQSHMAYSRDYVCPRSHPVKVPRIRLFIRYPIDRGQGVTLASGSPNTAHADFFNAWNQHKLERLVASCFEMRGCNPASSDR
ncbi:MAG TPA: DUF1996 domain-containing protein [Gaiellaceae bacterium]|nr:DUF1996 domain-containing protein [Gaiellaceae bacterium]